jgi:hypothetical protein
LRVSPVVGGPDAGMKRASEEGRRPSVAATAVRQEGWVETDGLWHQPVFNKVLQPVPGTTKRENAAAAWRRKGEAAAWAGLPEKILSRRSRTSMMVSAIRPGQHPVASWRLHGGVRSAASKTSTWRTRLHGDPQSSTGGRSARSSAAREAPCCPLRDTPCRLRVLRVKVLLTCLRPIPAAPILNRLSDRSAIPGSSSTPRSARTISSGLIARAYLRSRHRTKTWI